MMDACRCESRTADKSKKEENKFKKHRINLYTISYNKAVIQNENKMKEKRKLNKKQRKKLNYKKCE